MAVYLENKYLSMISSQLKGFKRKSSYVTNFRCPICKDSAKNERTARGYTFESKGSLIFHCHNCTKTLSVPDLVKHLNPVLYREYIKEMYSLNAKPVEVFVAEKIEPVYGIFSGLKKMSEMDPFHPAVKYIRKRKIPEEHWNLLYYAPKFKNFVNSVVPGKFKEVYEEPRLIIPFISNDGSVIAFQGRSFDPATEFRYITITLDTGVERVFGLERFDRSKRGYIVEGPLDSTFISNSLAVGGSNILSVLRQLDLDKSLTTIVFDKEPRNIEIVKKMQQCLDEGWSICIWPDNIEGKDINQMILTGKDAKTLLDVINQSVYSNLSGKAKLNMWKKI